MKRSGSTTIQKPAGAPLHPHKALAVLAWLALFVVTPMGCSARTEPAARPPSPAPYAASPRRVKSAVEGPRLRAHSAVEGPRLRAHSAVEGPRLRVVGSVQDGGLPHAACTCNHCQAARHDPARRRLVAALALVLPDKRQTYLVDATPDIRAQLDALADVRNAPAGRVDRAPVTGAFLTHAHLGHYTGLSFFGFEAVSTKDLPVLCSPRMAAFLRANGPWDQLVRLHNIALQELVPERPFALPDNVTVTPFAVPHRDEYSDTLAYVFRGPRSSVLYVPDTDSWARWSRPLPEVLADVDTALLDGTFYSMNELPGRDVAQIGHPLMTATMDLLEPLVRSGKTRVLFTHLNHSNPALDPESPERAEMRRRGFDVVEEGSEWPL